MLQRGEGEHDIIGEMDDAGQGSGFAIVPKLLQVGEEERIEDLPHLFKGKNTRHAIIDNLVTVGYTGWTGLILRLELFISNSGLHNF